MIAPFLELQTADEVRKLFFTAVKVTIQDQSVIFEFLWASYALNAVLPPTGWGMGPDNVVFELFSFLQHIWGWKLRYRKVKCDYCHQKVLAKKWVHVCGQTISKDTSQCDTDPHTCPSKPFYWAYNLPLFMRKREYWHSPTPCGSTLIFVLHTLLQRS